MDAGKTWTATGTTCILPFGGRRLTLIKTFLMQGAYFQFQDYEAFENACILRRTLFEPGFRAFHAG
ncbi:MAG: hypothetical protein R2860_09285 [Desulfobacterales bacterium]